ncbi:MAG TPA: copper resistance protein NlpE N-terminal domain-containing protein, partial [Vicinamibacteria bacterium]|nr:copper resistance protein NlpE N-terminal domain-containing protein [Vicinamibacteria bacterium]
MKATIRGLLSLIVSVPTVTVIAQAQDAAPPPRGQRIVGFFVGTVPCADCGGVLTELTLFSHDGTGRATYQLKETYLGKPAQKAVSHSSGTWALEFGRPRTKEQVYRLVDFLSFENRVFLRVSDDELRVADRYGRPAESIDYTLTRRPVPEKPTPHAAPPGRYLVGFYTGTLPCIDCEGIRVELSLFDGPETLGRPSYWLKETRVGGPASGAAESSGRWLSRKSPIAPETLLQLLDASQVFVVVAPDQLKLIQREAEEFPRDGAGIITRSMALPAGTRWYEAFGCSRISSASIDSVGGSVRCGETVIGFDMHGSAGDWCGNETTMDLSSVGRVPMKMCLLDRGTSSLLAVSLPDHTANLFVDRATPRDTMVLLAMARNLADL